MCTDDFRRNLRTWQGLENVEDAGGEVVQAQIGHTTQMIRLSVITAIKIRKNEGPTAGEGSRAMRVGVIGAGKRWCAESTFSGVKREFGKFARAAIIKYDVTPHFSQVRSE